MSTNEEVARHCHPLLGSVGNAEAISNDGNTKMSANDYQTALQLTVNCQCSMKSYKHTIFLKLNKNQVEFLQKGKGEFWLYRLF